MATPRHRVHITGDTLVTPCDNCDRTFISASIPRKESTVSALPQSPPARGGKIQQFSAGVSTRRRASAAMAVFSSGLPQSYLRKQSGTAAVLPTSHVVSVSAVPSTAGMLVRRSHCWTNRGRLPTRWASRRRARACYRLGHRPVLETPKACTSAPCGYS